MNFSDPVLLAQALLRCRSITPDHNDRGDDGAMDLVQGWLAALGFTVMRLDRGQTPNLYAKRGEHGNGALCFAGHTDVVPIGDNWTHDPFAGVIADGVLYGRGAVDMKGAVAAFIAATARQRHAAAALLITGDEEGRAADGTAYILEELGRRGETIKTCIVGEPTSSTKLGDTIKIGRRGSLNGRLTVHGVQGHSAYPQLADNPIPKLARLVEKIAAHDWDSGTGIFPATTLAFTNIGAGTGAANVIPGSASATFNVRFNPLQTPQSIEAVLRNYTKDCELELTCSALPFHTGATGFAGMVQNAVKTVMGISPQFSTDGGTSDARFIAEICANTVELGLINATAHKVDEGVSLADLETLTKIYECLLAA